MGQTVSLLPADALAYRAVPGGVAYVATDGTFFVNGTIFLPPFATIAERLHFSSNARVIGARISPSGVCAAIFVLETPGGAAEAASGGDNTAAEANSDHDGDDDEDTAAAAAEANSSDDEDTAAAANSDHAAAAADSSDEDEDEDEDDIAAVVIKCSTVGARGFTAVYNTSSIRRERDIGLLGEEILLDDGTLVILQIGTTTVDICGCNPSRPPGSQNLRYELDILSRLERGTDSKSDNYYRLNAVATTGDRTHVTLVCAFEGNNRYSGEPATWPLPPDRFGEELIVQVDFLLTEMDGTARRFLTPLEQPYGTVPCNSVCTLYLELAFGLGSANNRGIITAVNCIKDGQAGWVRAFLQRQVIFEKSPILPSGVRDEFAKCIAVPGGFVTMRDSGLVEVFARTGERIANLTRTNPTAGLSCSPTSILVGRNLLFRTTVIGLLRARRSVFTAICCGQRLQANSLVESRFFLPKEVWQIIHCFCVLV
jgi:hypothetical protein